jgi:predicted CoA-binding protein
VPHRNPANDELRKLLVSARTIAIVGASSNPDRASNGIMRKLKSAGYHVIPVNPNETAVLGERAYGSLREVPEHIDVVDVFRRPEYTPAIAADAASVKAGALWLQSGIVNEEAAATASAAGLTVVMDACIGVMHSLLQVGRKS